MSVDNGCLTVNGTINASGINPGGISLSAQDDLTLNGTLDAHGTVLQTDSYGDPIPAENSGQIVLTAMQGTLTLSPGAAFDLTRNRSAQCRLRRRPDRQLRQPDS